MDLRFGDSEPTDEERAAVDSLPARPRRLGVHRHGDGPRRPAVGRRWTEARDRRDLLLPGLHAVNDRVRLDQRGRPGLPVPAPDGAPGGGVRGRHLLRDVLGPPRPATVLHLCTDLACAAAGAGDLCAAVERRLGPGSGVRVERGPCLGLCERAPAALAVRAGRSELRATAVCAPATPDTAVHAATAPESAPAEPPPAAAVPQTGEPTLTLLGRNRHRRPHLPRRLPRPRRLHGAAPRLRAGPGRRHPRGHRRGPGRPRRRRLPTGRKWRATAARPDHPHYSSATPTSPSPTPSGPHAHGGRPVRARRGDDDRRVRHRRAQGYSTSAASTRAPCPPHPRHHAGPHPRLLGDDVLGQGYAFDIEIRRGAGGHLR